jgi:hypothetical protein
LEKWFILAFTGGSKHTYLYTRGSYWIKVMRAIKESRLSQTRFLEPYLPKSRFFFTAVR